MEYYELLWLCCWVGAAVAVFPSNGREDYTSPLVWEKNHVSKCKVQLLLHVYHYFRFIIRLKNCKLNRHQLGSRWEIYCYNQAYGPLLNYIHFVTLSRVGPAYQRPECSRNCHYPLIITFTIISWVVSHTCVTMVRSTQVMDGKVIINRDAWLSSIEYREIPNMSKRRVLHTALC